VDELNPVKIDVPSELLPDYGLEVEIANALLPVRYLLEPLEGPLELFFT
jgi:hypothetical protein